MTLDNVAYHLANGLEALRHKDLTQAEIGFDRGIAELDENKRKIEPVLAAAKQVHEAHQRTLREHNVAAHYSMDVAWDTLARVLKDLG